MLEAVSSPLLINFNVNESYKTYLPSMDEQKKGHGLYKMPFNSFSNDKKFYVTLDKNVFNFC